MGYRVKAVDPNQSDDAAREEGMKQFQSALMRRLALAESVAIIGILLAFIAKTVIIYDVGASISILLLMIHVWPSERSVDRVVTSLERSGARTGLREMLGFGGPRTAPPTGRSPGSADASATTWSCGRGQQRIARAVRITPQRGDDPPLCGYGPGFRRPEGRSVGVTGFEPAAFRSQSGRATKLRHTPRHLAHVSDDSAPYESGH